MFLGYSMFRLKEKLGPDSFSMVRIDPLRSPFADIWELSSLFLVVSRCALTRFVNLILSFSHIVFITVVGFYRGRSFWS